MIIFESFFKRPEERNASQAALRISKFISDKPSDQDIIYNNFFGDDSDSFCRIRNKIAHGDLSLDDETIRMRYPLLYGYITKTLIKFISVQREFNPKNEFHEEFEKIIKTNFNSLINGI